MTKIWLVRHSIREDSLTNNVASESDCSITAEGVNLAESIAKQLSSKQIKNIYSSPYKRAIQTAYVMSCQLNLKNIIITPLASEVITSFSKETGTVSLPPAMEYYFKANNITFPEKMENIQNRCKELLDDLKNKEDALIITHGGFINETIRLLYPKYIYEQTNIPALYKPAYCDYVCFEYINNQWIFSESNWIKLI